jgi:uncharacterized secreted protein with C-terminal beta-propeller domain
MKIQMIGIVLVLTVLIGLALLSDLQQPQTNSPTQPPVVNTDNSFKNLKIN